MSFMGPDRPWDDSVDSPPAPELVAIAHACFDFARAGDTPRLHAYIENGVPANLTDANRTNDRGQSPLSGAIFKGEADVVRVLLAAGADPDLGPPSARETAVLFEQTDLLPPTPQSR